MAFKNGLSERLDELRFTSPRSPPSESPFSGYTSPPRGQSNFMTAFQQPPQSNDVRANLQRRFTTDSSKLAWPPFSQQPTQLPDAPDLLSSFEKKRQHIEYMREQKKRFEADMKLLDQQQEKERHELDQIARDLAHVGMAGPVSEPTTPPENHRDSGFPTAFSRPTRFSTSSVTSSAGIFNIFAPSSQVTSPPSGQVKTSASQTPNSRFSAQSTPGSRRNSEEEYFPENLPTSSRPAPSSNRYSMPTTSLASQIRSNTSGFSNPVGLSSFNASKYLFGEEHEDEAKDEDRFPTPDIKTYLQLTDPDDKFPTLIRQDDHSGLLSANSAALDLANSRTPGPEPWNTHTRHRSSHQSLPQNSLNMFRVEHQLGSPPAEKPMNNVSARHLTRHSLGVNLGSYEEVINGSNGHGNHVHDHSSSRPVSLQSSYSTNDLPTVKGNGNGNGNGLGNSHNITPPNSHAEHFHKHNASLGRIPPNAIPRQKDHGHSMSQSQSQSSPERDVEQVHMPHQPVVQSALQASAAPFGPQLPSAVSPSVTGSITPTPMNVNGLGNMGAMTNTNTNAFPTQFYGYGMQPYQMNGQGYPSQAYSTFPNALSAYPQFPENRGRRNGDGDQLSRFTNVPLEHYKGELYGLCKDQHGCRYLQRKLEDRDPEHVQMIFLETHRHVVELMTDPFGNYLCQKLLEYSNDEQRTALIDNAAPQLVKIALNQHGTRALQKMIEFISTPEQTQTVIHSLRDRVVDLVQDLNGNHVIQKCLNRLSAEDAQFIYDAVGANCVTVGTHRHGCCVLQRCIDHASGEQRARLIAQITGNAFSLVQDPFGNYVVQYILDLSEPHFTEPLCHSFRGNVPALSKQKFSSNVIEKCLRTAAYQVRRMLIEEMLISSELEKMLRDSFANYVVQTAMDFADPDTKTKLVDAIRPILPTIRQTPHGRRIAGKMMGVDAGSGRLSGASSGQITPNDMTSGQLPAAQQQFGQNQLYGPQPNPAFPQNNFIGPGTQFPDSINGNGNGNGNVNGNVNAFLPGSVNGSNGNSNSTTPAANDGSGPTIFSPTPHHPNTGTAAGGPVQGYGGYF